MVRQETDEFEITQTASDAGEFAGWDPYVIWLCKQFTAPMEPLPADTPE